MAAVSSGTNALEYWIVGRWVGVPVQPVRAFRVTVLASVGNLAPLPGAALIRGRELFSQGADAGGIARSLTLIGMTWLVLSMLALGVAVATRGNISLGLFLAGVSMVGVVPMAMLLSNFENGIVALSHSILVETVSVAVHAGRLYTVFKAFGVEISIVQAFGFPVAAAVASVVGVLPGGLGLSELLAGGVAPFVGLDPALGVLATVADRIIGLAVLGLISALLIFAAMIQARD